MRRFAPICAVFILTMAYCKPTRQQQPAPTPPGEQQTAAPPPPAIPCPKDRPKKTFYITIHDDEKGVTADPDPPADVVCSGDTVHWKTDDGDDLTIAFKDATNPEPENGPDCIGKKKCHVKIKDHTHKDARPYKYSVTVDCSSKDCPHEVDPELVVAGGGT